MSRFAFHLLSATTCHTARLRYVPITGHSAPTENVWERSTPLGEETSMLAASADTAPEPDREPRTSSSGPGIGTPATGDRALLLVSPQRRICPPANDPHFFYL